MRDGEEPALRAQEDEGDDFAISPLDASRPAMRGLALRGPQRRVAALAATALLVAVVVVGLFAHATSDPSGALATLLLHPTTPTPNATFVPGANVIHFSNGAPWGTLMVDGARLPGATLTGQGISVTRGTHHLVYQARYFPSLRCTFSAPRAQSDTCPLDTSDSTLQYLLTQGLTRAIDLGSTGATLQPDQRAALTQRVDDLLNAQALTATIAPGDRYLDDQGHIATASAPLRFTLTLALDQSATSGGGCSQFCPALNISSQPVLPDGGWPMLLTITATWAITDASGHRLTPLNYLATQPFSNSGPVEVGIQLTPAGWKISALDALNTQIVDSAAGSAVQQTVDATNSGDGPAYSILSAPNPLDGCVMEVVYGGATSRVLWRFGVLLALDSSAHRIFPQLPIATAAEQALADRIASQPALRDDSILPTG